MIKVAVRLGLLFMIILVLGCAAGQPPESPVAQAGEEESDIIQLKCKAAHQHGCRYKGRVFPWNAWAEEMGYDSHHYEVLGVNRTGPTAIVSIVERN